MKNEIEVPIFLECTSCKRSIINNSPLWANLEKRICVCCDCFGFGTQLLMCKRFNCKYYNSRCDDFIIDIAENKEGTEIKPKVEAPVFKHNYSESSNKCYNCNKELSDFLYINGKATQFDCKGEVESRCKNIKVKLCPLCAKTLMDIIPISLVREEVK